MALLGSSDNQVDILIKSHADTKGVDETSRSLNKLDQDAGIGGRAIAALGPIGKVAAIGIMAVGTAVAAAGLAAIKSAGEYEQSRIAFNTMLGSAELAKDLMKQIAEFAKTTPFELPEVVAGTKQLLAFGFAQGELLPTMRKLGDLASGLGVPIGQLTNVFGQVKVAGRLMGQDLLQFTNAGVPMIEALSKTMQKPQSEIKKLVEEGKVGFPEVEAALNSLTGEGSKFGGMMQAQSNTFNGVVSNIKDGFGQMLRSAVGMGVDGEIVVGSLFDRLKNAAKEMMPVLQEFAQDVGPMVGEAMQWMDDHLGPLVANIMRLGEHLMPLLPVLGGVLVVALTLAVDALTLVTSGINWLIEAFQAGNPIIIGLATTFGILAAAMAFNATFNALTIGFNMLTLVQIPKAMASVSALSALIGTPMVMPAIAIGLALAAIATVWSEYNKMKATIEQTQDALAANRTSNDNALKQAKAQYDSGKITKERYNAIIKLANENVPAFAGGVRNFSGGMAIVGEQGPELVNLPKGSDVFTNGESKQMASGATGGRQVTHNGDNHFYTAPAVTEYLSDMDRDTNLVSYGFTPARGIS